MPSSRWGQVVDALLEVMRGQPGYRGPDGAAGVLVLDSTEAWATDLLVGDYLVVGWSDPDGSVEAGTAEQASATIGKVTRDEVGWVTCRAVAQPGAVEPKPARDTAFAILATVEAAVRAAPQLGLVTPRMHAQINPPGRRMSFEPYLAAGSVFAITFDVFYSTRI
jgi:hypothetical protein